VPFAKSFRLRATQARCRCRVMACSGGCKGRQKKSNGPHSRLRWSLRDASGRKHQLEGYVQSVIDLSTMS
jgi:hypothetical protein